MKQTAREGKHSYQQKNGRSLILPYELTFCAKQANVFFPVMPPIIQSEHRWLWLSLFQWSCHNHKLLIFSLVCFCVPSVHAFVLHLFFPPMCMCGSSGHCPWSAWTGVGSGGVWQRPWPGWLPGEVLPTVSMRDHPQSHAFNCMSQPPVPLQVELLNSHRTEPHFVRWSDGRPWFSHRLQIINKGSIFCDILWGGWMSIVCLLEGHPLRNNKVLWLEYWVASVYPNRDKAGGTGFRRIL